MQSISSISRTELFEALWQQPMNKLAEQWGISRKEILLICEQYDVPRPPNGYWAQLNWGTAPERPQLPPLDAIDRIELESFRKQFAKPVPNRESKEVISKAPEKEPPTSNAEPLEVIVPDELSNPHRCLKKLRSNSAPKATPNNAYDTPQASNQMPIQSWLAVSKPSFSVLFGSQT